MKRFLLLMLLFAFAVSLATAQSKIAEQRWRDLEVC